MGYQENVQALCNQLGIANPIQENDLTIKGVRFEHGDEWVLIEGTKMNRAGRLFFQSLLAKLAWKQTYEISKDIREEAAQFFAENWQDAETAGRAMLSLFKVATRFQVKKDPYKK